MCAHPHHHWTTTSVHCQSTLRMYIGQSSSCIAQNQHIVMITLNFFHAQTEARVYSSPHTRYGLDICGVRTYTRLSSSTTYVLTVMASFWSAFFNLITLRSFQYILISTEYVLFTPLPSYIRASYTH